MPAKPNLLFVFSDQQHWQAAGFVDASFRTPNLDQLAAEGTVFTQAFCTTPQCSPSRSSLLTGLYPAKTGVLGNVGAAGGEPLRLPTVGPLLQEAGYRTAYFGKWHLGKDPVGTAGWDEDFGVTGKETNDDRAVTRRALDFLAGRGGEPAPFALFLSYTNPHDVYHFDREKNPAPKASHPLPDSWHRKDLSTVPKVQRQFMDEDQGRVIVAAEAPAWERYREIYREKVALYDRELGQVLAALEDAGLAGSTLVIVTSDHGDMDTQQGLIYKGPFLYEHMMRVPFVVRLPGSRVSRQVDFPTVNVDVVPTLADFAGVVPPPTDGVSLRPFLDGSGPLPERDQVVGQYYSKQEWVNPIRMLRTRRHKYNLYRVHGEELYDLENDPGEIHNLAEDAAHAAVKAQLADRLAAWMQANGDPFPTQSPTTRDGTPLAVG
ncbi:MAG: sulfatase-like hydrolase/transferase [Lentisphaeria bacterium]|nr:sulfatase-like hydrolase/transferase [Lentisphaeria bacterium]